MSELPKAYEPKLYEDDIYKLWEKSGFFAPTDEKKEPYSIMMPPPNVTGVLHLGHALEHSLMDVMARYQRMKGKNVLLLPGTDHAAVATQAKVEKVLVEKGMKNPREELGREKLLEKIREYSEESKATIIRQIKKMGTSCDWSRLAYTFDEARSRAVNAVFAKMFADGLIYRGYRVVNWTVLGQSTCSDDELVHVERPSKLYYFKYSKDFPITIATTRPETKLGDTAVAVNPKDKRYKKYIGQIFAVEVGALAPLQIKIIADENVDPNFGSGALGVTPAHSAIDFEMYVRQKAKNDPIGIVPVIGTDGRMAKEAGEGYAGLAVEEAREKFVAWLRENELLEKEEDIIQNVGTSDRFGDVVEALPLTQWFVDVNKKIKGKNKTLKELMKEAVAVGHNDDPKQKITITPDRFEQVYYSWINNLRDWCISRQIWWGHRVPVYYCIKSLKHENIKTKCNETIVSVEVLDKCPNCGGEVEQDPDTLDTWFSSGLWTFSTLGWPDQTNDLKIFHPTSWMQMGYEIVFFWMARMILMSTYVMDQVPFKEVYIHGMLRDQHGKKFSKSAENGIDPIDMINEYGADALRLSVLSGITPGNDARFYIEKIESARNFVNKLWNISRFILTQVVETSKSTDKTLADHWILGRLKNTQLEVGNLIEKSEFSLAVEKLREFTWSELADWYVEIGKVEGGKSEIMLDILKTVIKLWHPFIPFVTEKIWSEIQASHPEAVEPSLLLVSSWPACSDATFDPGAEVKFNILKDIITGIRSLRADYHIEPAKKLDVVISAGMQTDLLAANVNVLKGLARLENCRIEKKLPKLDGSIGFVAGNCEVYIDVAGVLDIAKEKSRLEKDIMETKKYIGVVEKKLENKDFTEHAPAAVVEGEKKKLADAVEKLKKVSAQYSSLS